MKRESEREYAALRQDDSFLLRPLNADDLPLLAAYQGCMVDDLLPMLQSSQRRCHEGRYYEQFAICADGRLAGLASLYAHGNGEVSDGVEVFPPFRRCGYAGRALHCLEELARLKGYELLTAQVRTDNAASIALHTRCGFVIARTYVNRRGREVYRMEKSIGGSRICDMK